MKKFIQCAFLPFLFLSIGLHVNAQTAGFNSTFAVLSINGGANTYYDLQAATANADFNGANLGNFTTSNSLVLKGAEHNVFKCGGCDLTSTRIYYRMYLSGSTPGAFSNLNIGFAAGGANGCGGEDQQWANTGFSTNILSGLAPGNYTFEVYSDASVTCLGGTIFAGNFGANYKATFNFCGPTSGPLPVGNYAIPGCFPTIASAVTYLNANGVTGSGTVQFDVAAGHTETAPASGITFNGQGTAGNLATGTATTAIVFKKSGVGANPIITAPLWVAGGLRDIIVKIISSDYITLDGLTIQENPANTNVTIGATNTMSEVGIGFFIANATSGAQFNTIQNCTISLNSNFPNSVGIFSTSSSSVLNFLPSASNTAGTNSNNKIYSNTITNVAYGFYAISELATATLNESGWDIGGTSAATGNTIIFGNPIVSTLGWSKFSSLSDAGIHFRNQTGINVQYNTIISTALTYQQTNLGGIIITRSTLSPSTGVVYSAIIKNNTINLTNNGLQSIIGIDYGYGNTTATIEGNNNTISLVDGATGASSGNFYGIKANYPSSSATYSNNIISMNHSGSGTFIGSSFFINSDGNTNDLTIQNNLLQSVGSHLKATGQFFGISNLGNVSNSVTIGGSLATANTINIIRNGAGTFNVYGIYADGASTATSSYNVNFNSITISSGTGSNGTFGINNTNGVATTNKFFNNNTITLSGAPNGATIGFYISNGTVSASNNNVTIASSSSTVLGLDFSVNGSITSGIADNNTFTLSSSGNNSPNVRGITTSATTVTNGFTITNNNINSIATSTLTGSPQIHGVIVSIGTNNIISGNTIKNFSTAATVGSAKVNGISIGGGTDNKVFNNNINNLSSSSLGTSSTLTGISISSLTPLLNVAIYNNFISDLKAPAISAAFVLSGISCNALSTTYNVYHNTIKIGDTSPISGGSNFAAVGVGVNDNLTATILDLRNNIINMNVTPSGLGSAACVGFSTGTANVVPTAFASTSNNNIYAINSGVNNYLYVQGTNPTLTLVNGYAVSGLTPNATNNINNDVNFNATCGLYKSFMGGVREAMTYNETNLAALSPVGVFAPSGSSFAENGAQAIASITTDFNGVNRTPTNDIGALQFSGTGITFTDPILTPTFTAIAPICSGDILLALPTTSINGITGTWSPALDNMTTTTYTFTPTAGQCATIVTLTITVIPSVTITTTITACNTYTWTVNGTTYMASGSYSNVVGCTTNILNLTIQPLITFYQDTDGDGYGNPAVTISACVIPVGYVLIGTDCNDANPAINPAAIDICLDGIDNDCNGIIDNIGQPGGCILITTNVVSASCGAIINNLSVTIAANFISGAQGYRFRVRNLVTNVVFIVDRPVNSFALSNYPGITLATPYQIDIALRLSNVWQPFYGAPCTVTTPSPITTLAAQCNTTLTSMTQLVYCTYIQDVIGYRYKITNTVTNAVQILDLVLNRFFFNQVPNRTYGTTYFVEIAVRNTDGTYLPYGPGCTITTQAFPTSQIVTSQCNTTATSNTQTFNAVLVSAATNYRFQLVNTSLGYNATIDRTLNTFNLSLFSGLLPGTTYVVRVAVRIDGIWGPLTGIPCNIKTPGVAPISTRLIETNTDFVAIAYPNPFANTFMFDIKTKEQSTIQIKVYDILGKLIENRNVEVSEITNLEIGVNYPSGIYNVIVSQEDKTQTVRVIKR